jgi:hypothetical protein
MELLLSEYMQASRGHRSPAESDSDGVLMGSFLEGIQRSRNSLNLKEIWWAVTGSNCGPPACKR